MNTHTIVADMHQNMLKTRKAADGQNWAVSDARSLYIVELNLTAA